MKTMTLSAFIAKSNLPGSLIRSTVRQAWYALEEVSRSYADMDERTA